MTPAIPEIDIEDLLRRTSERQRQASDPSLSAWVSANAGTGKTHVLTMRVLRLLIAGTMPERILCLTYTKAAAAEMSTRVFNRLAKWVTADEDDLGADLDGLLGRAASPEERLLARTLFTRAIETPGGLKVQTIHAFCERLLQRFPMEAGVPPAFSTLDDDLGRTLKKEAIAQTVTAALRDRETPLGRALATVVAYASEYSFEDVLKSGLAQSAWLRDLDEGYHDAIENGGTFPPLAEFEAHLRRELGAPADGTPGDIERRCGDVLDDATLASAIAILQDGSRSDMNLAASLRRAQAARQPRGRGEALKAALLTKDIKPRARLMTAGLKDANQGLHARLCQAQDQLHRLVVEHRALRTVEATVALTLLSTRVLVLYMRAKERRAALDFDDLIEKAVILLGDNEWTQWVLYKLDGGIEHILVDESQDTSPSQWRIVEALSEEFHVGDGQSEGPRTLFAVGDEKQSIYSFQGAAPEQFALMGQRFKARAEAGSARLEHVPLNLSFRTVAPVLECVDTVFADGGRTRGLNSDGRDIRHEVKRLGDGGLVEVWETEKPDSSGASDAFSPLDETARQSPVERLAARIADTIAGWVETGEQLVSRGRPVRPGDILILCRKRRPFAAPMVAALKAKGIAVAGADRLVLTQQLAVQDLVALGQFATLPEDDLTLAALLKSPLVGLSEEALFDLAHGRRGTLWKALIDKSGDSATLREAAGKLRDWRQRADYLPPFEFYARLLDEDGVRGRLLSRLGQEAADPIDEFLNLAIDYDEGQAPSLTGFLDWLTSSDREIKRDMEQTADEVRVMTVHASKGLEAPIVFLPDGAWSSSAGGPRETMAELDAEPVPHCKLPPRAWVIKGASRIEAIAEAKEAKKRREAEELNRLLYVAMTRAEDRLYVCGFDGGKPRSPDCWYDIICERLKHLEVVELPDGRRVKRLEAKQTAAPSDSKKGHAAAIGGEAPPRWAFRRAPRVPSVALPLKPSQLAPYETDDEGEPVAGPEAANADLKALEEPAAEPAGAKNGEVDRFLRGNLTHALFEHLPDVAAAERAAVAEAFVASRGSALPAVVRRSIVREVTGVLEDPVFSALFGARSRAEVAVAAALSPPDGIGPVLRLSGSIDRLAEVDGGLMIVDFKTNRHPGGADAPVPEAYLLQLASYRLALKSIYPGRPVRAALLWTRSANMTEVSEDDLDAAERRLWMLSRGST